MQELLKDGTPCDIRREKLNVSSVRDDLLEVIGEGVDFAPKTQTGADWGKVFVHTIASFHFIRLRMNAE